MMQHKQLLDELDYYRAQKIAEYLYHMNLITFEEFNMLTQKIDSHSHLFWWSCCQMSKKESVFNETEWRCAV